MLIRQVESYDTGRLIELFNRLDSETEFMLLEPGERDSSVDKQAAIIGSFEGSDSRAMFVAESAGGELVGFVVGTGGAFSRNRHSLSCVIGVAQSCTGQGLGKRLMQGLEAWAKQKRFYRLELTVMTHNHRAIRLYESCGFDVEGRRRDALNIGGCYVDEFYMAKLLARP